MVINTNLFLVITDYNGSHQTKNCLDALRASVFQDFTVVVVDHGTTNDTQKLLECLNPDVVRIVGPPELWWAGATNLGIRYALSCGADMVMLLNNDCYMTPDTLDELIELRCENPRSLIAPVQRDKVTGKILTITPSSCFLLGFPTLSGPRTLTTKMHAQRLLSTQLICGGRGVLMPAVVFQEIGFFDEVNLPHYGADHDFYLRAKKNKWPLYVATRAVVDIDTTRSTMAESLDRMSFRQWIGTLSHFRSHRNVSHVSNLFKKHYPIKQLYLVGVFLYFARYLMMFLIKRGPASMSLFRRIKR